MARHVSSLYKGRSAVLDTPVPDGLPEPLSPISLPLPPLNGARMRWQNALRALRWRRVQHEWTAWMRGLNDAVPCAPPLLPLLDAPIPDGLPMPLVPDVAAVMSPALASEALPYLIGSVAVCAAVVRATAAVAVCDAVVRATAVECAKESVTGPRVSQRRRGVRGGRRAASRRAARC